MKIRIEPAGLEFEAAAGRTVLQAAHDAGIDLPTSCRNGTCRACMCRMDPGGAVRYRIEWPGLLREEKAEGWILPCVAEPLADLRLHVPLAVRFPDGD
ncbi:2Fe-2S iron-sulfur cluster-binding protein [Variovorax sp.]|uniref:2Fe-2S iron-sulfur cluster-binding protein n=1 Tax=Variovorax sp. TaxID=1871043 RepID=UPI002D353FF6|nr:2Fe-2S iron-sulfur cluster-binding protein [Variovorax sp.]HYP85014.1 2Fe-2S iron-sulfur cluster-binding protein [Variovorax sp.]